MKTLTIYDIKRFSEDASPYFFDRKTLKFFGQTMKDFKVYKQTDGRYLITAPMFDRFTGKQVGTTTRYFNPINNKLEQN
ncbi:MAG: hypothetical protein WCI57_04925 [Candidatus Berkelbacteria bacterium]